MLGEASLLCMLVAAQVLRLMHPAPPMSGLTTRYQSMCPCSAMPAIRWASDRSPA